MEEQKIFGFFTLRVSIITLAFGFFSLAWAIILVNVMDFKEYPVGCTTAMLNAATMIIIWGLALHGAVKAKYGSILMSTVLWTVFVVIWSMLVLISCIESTSAILVNHRGPESVWLLRNMYNLGDIDLNYEYYDHIQHEHGMCINRLSSAEKATPADFRDGAITPRVLMSKTIDYLCMKWLLIFICFVTFSYIIYGSWFVLYSYCKEMQYTLACVCPTVKCNSNVQCINA